MQLRPAFVATLAAVLMLLTACSDDADGPRASGDGSPTPIPTATPFASLPEPIIVTARQTDDETDSSSTDSDAGSTTYIVEAGDTLSGIASRFDTTTEAIQEANDLDGVDIVLGQELVIPGGADATEADDDAEGDENGTAEPEEADEAEETSTPEPPDTATPEPDDTATPEPSDDPPEDGDTDGQTYVVEDGDTASGIAAEFDISVEELAEANGMTEEEIVDLQIGDELVIPQPE